MALVSPGVEVTVVDESFYTPAEPGTLPLIFVASASNKPNGSGTGVAPGTLSKNAGVPYLLTSQRDLVDTFGDPIFKTDTNNNPIHGGELNEYGLQAAYSYLGVANRAWVCRADIDLGELEATAEAPGGEPSDGTYWFDTSTSYWGVQEWNGASIINNGQRFTNKAPIVITEINDTENTGSFQINGYDGVIPKKSVGVLGDYAAITTSTLNRIFYRNAEGIWVLVGSPAWIKSHPVIQGVKANPVFNQTAPGAFNIVTTNDVGGTVSTPITVAQGDSTPQIVSKIENAYVSTGHIRAKSVFGRLEIYTDGTDGLGNTIDAITLVNLPGSDNLAGPLGDDGFGFSINTATNQQTYYIPKMQISRHTNVPEYKTNDTTPRPTGSLWIKTTTPNLGANLNILSWNNSTKLWDTVDINIFSSHEEATYELDRAGGGENLLAGTIYALSNVAGDDRPMGTFKFFRRSGVAPTSVSGIKINKDVISLGTHSFKMSSTDSGTAAMSTEYTITANYDGEATDADVMASAINDANVPNVSARVNVHNKVVIEHSLGGDIEFNWESSMGDNILYQGGFVPYNDGVGALNLSYKQGTDENSSPIIMRGSLWDVLKYTASDDEITSATVDNALWYNAIVDECDILVHNGYEFVGYLYDGASGESPRQSPYYNIEEHLQPDPAGPIVAATTPITQSDGTPLVSGDLWIDTSDLENYPLIHRYNGDRTDLPVENRWFVLDSSDQTTEDGILFADARYNTAGSNSDSPGEISELLASDFVDPDSPDPALYPKGMLLFNLRRSGFNVKRYVRNYIDRAEKNIRYNDQPMGDAVTGVYARDRWVTESGNKENGAGNFGYHSQRKVVIQKLQAMVNSNEEIRDDESRLFNLMACPAYPELLGEMKSLNNDRGLTAFIVGDSPFRLANNGTQLFNWATNQNIVAEDNADGLVTTDPYMAVYYPCGYTSDNFGNNVVVPASHMMLRTMALSDQVSYPWFAPAGTRRGNITNATSSGFITEEGEFKSVALNEGLRDTLYSNNVNPITFVTGAGLVCFGQKTRQLVPSALDRVNVARLIVYLRSTLRVLAKPYLFEPNDKITRDEIKQQVETMLLELVGLRALYDFLVVCDETNNTPARIDRNELYVDIAIEPVKAIEFIYIPIRIKNTGEIAGLS
jgi:hypothetical protein